MQKKWGSRPHTMQSVFVFLLIGLFALASITLAVIGTRVYREVTAAASNNNDSQMLLSYLSNKVRAFDEDGSVQITNQGGISTLHLSETLEGVSYETTIYCWQGEVWERFAPAEAPFAPQDAAQLTQANSLTFAMIGESLIEATIEMHNGDSHTLHMALRANAMGEVN